MLLYYTVWVCWSDYVCLDDPKWSVITVWWKKIYILMPMKCISLSCQTFNVAAKFNFNFARSLISNFSEFPLWNSWCIRSKSHVFFSFFGLVASKTCTSPSILRHIITLQCSYSVNFWHVFEGGGRLRCQLNLNFELILSLDSCCFRYFSYSFAIQLVLSRKHVLISILNMGYWTKSKEWVTSKLLNIIRIL
jgi:hypothetical protein